eukprot:TRINITY_DN56197_c0_g1_i1.p1 TRINITY_DN56197_c0_g1~~TRINITY_DN56197_c0_g1_i1.p1  ORF type:complete len:177 (-),score=15.29 TRINITY_DN56197_c0_g1_i1:54-584(-)
MTTHNAAPPVTTDNALRQWFAGERRQRQRAAARPELQQETQLAPWMRFDSPIVRGQEATLPRTASGLHIVSGDKNFTPRPKGAVVDHFPVVSSPFLASSKTLTIPKRLPPVAPATKAFNPNPVAAKRHIASADSIPSAARSSTESTTLSKLRPQPPKDTRQVFRDKRFTYSHHAIW